MRPKKHKTTGSGDLFRARLEQIINMKHELVLLAGKMEWQWIDSEIAPLYSDKGRPGIETRFVIGLLLLKHIYGLSDEGVCERPGSRMLPRVIGGQGGFSGSLDDLVSAGHDPGRNFEVKSLGGAARCPTLITQFIVPRTQPYAQASVGARKYTRCQRAA